MVNWAGTMGKLGISEWLWRFMAAVMVFAVGWTMWIFYQLNAPPLITSAAFEAAAEANAKQNAKGVIAPAVVPAAPAAEVVKEPPINADKLKFSEDLSTPVKK
jgi:hypothetical protein